MTANSSNNKNKASAITEGFGFNPKESVHHFQVTIPDSKSKDVLISEHLNAEDDEDGERKQLNLAMGQQDNKLRVILKYAFWQTIADEVRVEFNLRLRRADQKSGQWQVPGITKLARTYGKELVLLAWAIEEADPNLIPQAVQNWKGLQPEERWWLFTMTNAQSGHATGGRGIGWRKAVRYALTENPVAGLNSLFAAAYSTKPIVANGQLTLLENDQTHRRYRLRTQGQANDTDTVQLLNPDEA